MKLVTPKDVILRKRQGYKKYYEVAVAKTKLQKMLPKGVMQRLSLLHKYVEGKREYIETGLVTGYKYDFEKEQKQSTWSGLINESGIDLSMKPKIAVVNLYPVSQIGLYAKSSNSLSRKGIGESALKKVISNMKSKNYDYIIGGSTNQKATNLAKKLGAEVVHESIDDTGQYHALIKYNLKKQ